MKTRLGHISEITRYPVKSFAGESLESCFMDTYGLYGDRFCAFYDETKAGWASFVTARDIPSMLEYKARLIDQAISVTSPNGQSFDWDEELLEDIQRFTKRKLSMTDYKAPHPVNPRLMSVDQASVLIVTDASLRKLESIWGKPADPRRFRSNLLLATDENTMHEAEWIGRQLSIGEVELEVNACCERCSMITIDPDTLDKDSSLLEMVYREMELCFGVYASVKKSGQITVGQEVYLSE